MGFDAVIDKGTVGAGVVDLNSTAKCWTFPVGFERPLAS